MYGQRNCTFVRVDFLYNCFKTFFLCNADPLSCPISGLAKLLHNFLTVAAGTFKTKGAFRCQTGPV